MPSSRENFENPTLGYVVIAVALAVGMLAANAVGQSTRENQSAGEQTRNAEQVGRLIPPPTSHVAGRRWVLGVRAAATDTGYLVQDVEHGSAASHFGLEVGDRIVTVNGVQVGKIDRRLVRLSDQLEHQGGESGKVMLLVQDRRNGRLVAHRVELRHPIQLLGHTPR